MRHENLKITTARRRLSDLVAHVYPAASDDHMFDTFLDACILIGILITGIRG